MKIIPLFILLVVFFDISLGQTNESDTSFSSKYKLNLEYNVMTNVSLEKPRRYKNTRRYNLIEEGIYLDLKEKDSFKYRMTISYELVDDNTNGQYPLEDILDEYLLYVSHFFRTKKNTHTIELGGDLSDLVRVKNELIGKKIFNRDYIGEDGEVYVKLVIE